MSRLALFLPGTVSTKAYLCMVRSEVGGRRKHSGGQCWRTRTHGRECCGAGAGKPPSGAAALSESRHSEERMRVRCLGPTAVSLSRLARRPLQTCTARLGHVRRLASLQQPEQQQLVQQPPSAKKPYYITTPIFYVNAGALHSLPFPFLGVKLLS